VQTDTNNPNNKQNTIIHGNGKGTCVLIGVAISGDRNVIKKVVEMTVKCRDLQIEIRSMRNAEAKVIPEIVGAIGTISNHTEY
jgi:uncharacterized radical SAM superfamily protein